MGKAKRQEGLSLVDKEKLKLQLGALIEKVHHLDLDEKVELINAVKLKLHEASPFKSEPVDCVLWRRAEANSGALYVQEWGNVNGYRRITKPEGHTWESFAKLLVNSMPPQTKEHFENKIFKFIEWWEARGYSEGIPDEADHALEVKKLAPSWRRVCKSLLRNDFWCKGLSFTQTKSDAYKRYLAMMKEKKAQAEFAME